MVARLKKWRNRLWPKSLSGQLILLLLLALVVIQCFSAAIFLAERREALQRASREEVMNRTVSLVEVLHNTPNTSHTGILRSASTPLTLFSVSDTPIADPSISRHQQNTLARNLKRAMAAYGIEQVSVDRTPATLIDDHGNPLAHGWEWTKNEAGEEFSEVKRGEEKHHDKADSDRFWGKREKSGWFFDDHEDSDEKRRDDEEDRKDDDEKPRWGGGPPPFGDRHGPEGRRSAPFGPPPGLLISVKLNDTQWLNVENRVMVQPPFAFLSNALSSLLMALAVVVIIILMIRRITKPLKELSAAADKLGRGEFVEPIKERGPADIRQTTHAFNMMNERLKRFVKDKLTMLAALSHDLRTPMTTLRLRAELLDDSETRNKILKTLDEMQAMAEATLSYIREEASQEETQTVDLCALASSLCEDMADAGQAVTFDECDPTPYPCRPVSLKRALTNLVVNAIKYGQEAHVSFESTETDLFIHVQDRGPGIPEDRMEDIFKPFVRLEESRNSKTGGIGLGLAITRSIARAHGGDVELKNTKNGLRVSLRLPHA